MTPLDAMIADAAVCSARMRKVMGGSYSSAQASPLQERMDKAMKPGRWYTASELSERIGASKGKVAVVLNNWLAEGVIERSAVHTTYVFRK